MDVDHFITDKGKEFQLTVEIDEQGMVKIVPVTRAPSKALEQPGCESVLSEFRWR